VTIFVCAAQLYGYIPPARGLRVNLGWGARILEARSFGRVPLRHMAHPKGTVAAWGSYL
jgi:hypothetical protein